MTLRRKLGGLIAGVDIKSMEDELAQSAFKVAEMWFDIHNIEEATRNGKSGTARKINRMARTALGLDDNPMKLGA